MLENEPAGAAAPRLEETIARLRVCRDAGVPVSAELLQATIRAVEATFDATAKRRQRNALIRRAALLLDGRMATYAKAAELLAEAKALARTRRPESEIAITESVRSRLFEAAGIQRLPGSRRSFYRVLIRDSD